MKASLRLMTRGGRAETDCGTRSARSAGSGAIYNHKTNDLAILEHGAHPSLPSVPTLSIMTASSGCTRSGPHVCHALRLRPPLASASTSATREERKEWRPSKRLERQRGHGRGPVPRSLVPFLPDWLSEQHAALRMMNHKARDGGDDNCD